MRSARCQGRNTQGRDRRHRAGGAAEKRIGMKTMRMRGLGAILAAGLFAMGLLPAHAQEKRVRAF